MNIQEIANKLENNSIVESVSYSDTSLSICLSTDMSVLHQGSYSFDNDDFENAPEEYTFEAEINLSFDDEELEITESIDIFSCRADKGQGDWDGWQMTNNISSDDFENTLEGFIDAAETVMNEIEEYNGKESVVSVSLVETVHSDFHNDYVDQHLYIGQRGGEGEYFFATGDNHVSHNHQNERGIVWESYDEFDTSELHEEHKERFAEIEKEINSQAQFA